MQVGDLRMRQRTSPFDETVCGQDDSRQPAPESQWLQPTGTMPEARIIANRFSLAKTVLRRLPEAYALQRESEAMLRRKSQKSWIVSIDTYNFFFVNTASPHFFQSQLPEPAPKSQNYFWPNLQGSFSCAVFFFDFCINFQMICFFLKINTNLTCFFPFFS